MKGEAYTRYIVEARTYDEALARYRLAMALDKGALVPHRTRIANRIGRLAASRRAS